MLAQNTHTWCDVLLPGIRSRKHLLKTKRCCTYTLLTNGAGDVTLCVQGREYLVEKWDEIIKRQTPTQQQQLHTLVVSKAPLLLYETTVFVTPEVRPFRGKKGCRSLSPKETQNFPTSDESPQIFEF